MEEYIKFIKEIKLKLMLGRLKSIENQYIDNTIDYETYFLL